MFTNAMAPKKRAACDQCRFRKVKCSGETPCGNCHKDQAVCTYSTQKPMGRPRKRQRPVDEGVFALQDSSGDAASFELSHVFSNDVFALEGSSGDFTAEDPPGTGPAQPEAEIPTGPSMLPPCACLSLAYLTMSRLQSLDGAELPITIADLQSALASSVQILKCPHCPRQALSAIQNLYQLSMLLTSIVDRIRKSLEDADANAQADGERDITAFAHLVEENNPTVSHHQFRLLLHKLLKDRILGSPGDTGDSTLFGIVHQFEQRQTEWHEDPRMYDEQAKMFGKRSAMMHASDPRSRVCYKLIDQIKNSLELLDL